MTTLKSDLCRKCHVKDIYVARCISERSPICEVQRCGCLPVAVVVVLLLVVEAAVLEGLVPFLVPVTNSICETEESLEH